MLDPLQLKLQAIISCPSWILGTRLGSSAGTLCILNHAAMFQPPPSGPFRESYAHRNWRSPEGERWLFWFKKKKKTMCISFLLIQTKETQKPEATHRIRSAGV